MKSEPWLRFLKKRATNVHNQLQIKTQTIAHLLSVSVQKVQKTALRRIFYVASVAFRRLRRLIPTPREWRRIQRIMLHIDRPALAPYMGLLIIAVFVIIGNQANQSVLAAHAGIDSPLVDLPPETVQEVLSALDSLTPELREEPEIVASGLVGQDGLYLTAPNIEAMTEAATLSKKDPIPYVVQKGDTMVSIAKANLRTVATILDANGIKPEDAAKLQPGTTLLIPQEDTSDSLAWLEADQKARAEAQKKRAEQLAKASKSGANKAVTSREQSNLTYDGITGEMQVPIRHNGISRGLGRGHTGIDYRANVGTPVSAAANGRVIEITRGWAGGWGISILLDNGSSVTSRYAHLSDVDVSIGQTVSQGEVIGYSGNTGRSTGPHLHFEVRVNGRAVNPF